MNQASFSQYFSVEPPFTAIKANIFAVCLMHFCNMFIAYWNQDIKSFFYFIHLFI